MSGQHPSIDEMIDDLQRFGWTRVQATTWKSPDGRFFRGPFQAWRVARSEAHHSDAVDAWRKLKGM